MDTKVQYWIDLSLYDLETASAMFSTSRWLYVGFMCHQSIEKILKAYWQKEKDSLPPRTHNLSYLMKETGLDMLMTEDFVDFIDELEPLNLQCRYPESIGHLSGFNEIDAKGIIAKTRELHQWIQNKLSL